MVRQRIYIQRDEYNNPISYSLKGGAWDSYVYNQSGDTFDGQSDIFILLGGPTGLHIYWSTTSYEYVQQQMECSEYFRAVYRLKGKIA